MHGLCVAVSGTGSLLEAMIAKELPISLVFADRKCRGLEIAERAGISTHLLERTDFTRQFDRVSYTDEAMNVFDAHNIRLIAMAGFMTIWAPKIFVPWKGLVTNIHPSLLPAFKGEKAVADALKFGVKVTGTTVHLATKRLDHGPILAQRTARVLKNDTVETLWERIKKIERQLYPRVLRDWLERWRARGYLE